MTSPGPPARPGLRHVLPAAAAALGVSLSETASDVLTLAGTDHLCVVLVDGLGRRQLDEHRAHAPWLHEAAATGWPVGTHATAAPGDMSVRGRVIDAPFPSTTAVSLGVFGTGRSPGQTGLLGYALREPGANRLVNMLRWESTTPPEEFQPYPTVLEECVRAGVRVTSIGAERFRASGMSRAALRGGHFEAATTWAGAVDRALAAMSGPGRSLTYLYWGALDKAGHAHGCSSWQWANALEEVEDGIKDLVQRASGSVVVTADHGMVDIPADARTDVASEADLRKAVVCVGGEPRALHLYCEPGAAPAVARRWRQRFGSSVTIWLRQELIDSGLLGPVDDRNRPLLGDVVVAVLDRHAIVDSRVQSVGAMSLVGMHGSTTPEETEIPLIEFQVRGVPRG